MKHARTLSWMGRELTREMVPRTHPLPWRRDRESGVFITLRNPSAPWARAPAKSGQTVGPTEDMGVYLPMIEDFFLMTELSMFYAGAL